MMVVGGRGKGKEFQGPLGEARKVYVETSVWGMTLGDQPRALREPTQEFLEQCALGLFVPYISRIVLGEISLAPPFAAGQMVRQINKLAPAILELSNQSEDLAESYLRAGIIPAKKKDDARHVAIASVGGIEILVSWNHRHLANERKRTLFNAVNRLAGYNQELLILTPFEAIP